MNKFCSDFHCSIACFIVIEGWLLVVSALNLCRSDSLPYVSLIIWWWFPQIIWKIQRKLLSSTPLHSGVIGYNILCVNTYFFKKIVRKMKEPIHHII